MSQITRDARGVGLLDELLGLGQGPEDRVDGAEVGDVIAAVGERRGVPRHDPDRVVPEAGQVWQRERRPARSPTPSPLPSAKLRK